MLVAVPALTIATASTAEAKSPDTPDNHEQSVFDDDYATNGTVTWNDYDNEFHHKDYDNFWLTDDYGDNESVQLRVYWKGKTHVIHAYEGKTAKLDIGNVPNNKKVYFKVCDYYRGEELHCTDKNWFKE